MSVTDTFDPSKKRSLLYVALDLLNDGCPDEERMQICKFDCMDECMDACYLCWSNFLWYVASGRTYDPYRCERSRDE